MFLVCLVFICSDVVMFLCHTVVISLISSLFSCFSWFFSLLAGLMEHTKRLLRAFFELSQTHRGELLYSKEMVKFSYKFYFFFLRSSISADRSSPSWHKPLKLLDFTNIAISKWTVIVYFHIFRYFFVSLEVGKSLLVNFIWQIFDHFPFQLLEMFFLSLESESRRLQPVRRLLSLLMLTAALRSTVFSYWRPSSL